MIETGSHDLAESVSEGAISAPSITGFPSVIEGAVSRIWADLFGSEGCRTSSNFIESGGDSLLIAQVLAEVRETFGVHVTPRQFLDNPTVHGLSRTIREAVTTVRRGAGGGIPQASRSGLLPPSLSQAGLLFRELQSEVRGHVGERRHMTFGLMFEGELDPIAVQRALNEIVRRHEILRSVFSPDITLGALKVDRWASVSQIAPFMGGGPTIPDVHFKQQIQTDAVLELLRLDLDERVGFDQKEVLQRIADEIGTPDIDYERAPLMRAALLRRTLVQHVLIVCASDLVFDEASWDILQRELRLLYISYSQGTHSQLPELSAQYVDFSVWQRQRIRANQEWNRLTAFWDKQYRACDFLNVRALPFALPASMNPNLNTGVESLELDVPWCRKLRSFAAGKGVLPEVIFFSALNVLMHHFTDRESIGLAVPFPNRIHPDIERVIGRFEHTHLIVTRLSGDIQIDELLESVNGAISDACAHQELPHSLLARYIRNASPGTVQTPPELQIAFHVRNYRRVFFHSKLTATRIDLAGITHAERALRIAIDDRGEEMTLTGVYRSDMFSGTNIRALLVSLRGAVERMVATPNERALDLLSSAVGGLLQ